MIEPRLILCGGATHRGREESGRKVEHLTAHGSDPTVTIKINDIGRIFLGSVAPRMLDLLEIAAYVFTADAGTRRGTAWIDDAIEQWSRDFKFVVPVRDLDFWQRSDVQNALAKALNFLSNDKYSFRFVRLKGNHVVQEYLELGTEAWEFGTVRDVLMFSGGLDSLAGAVESAASSSAPLMLVSHRPVGQVSARQRRLFAELQARFPPTPMLHVPIWINKANRLGHEPTQRTRSFLFTAIGLCAGSMANAQRIVFFENGIVSLNLPVADEVLRARASRTTHPQSLRLLSSFAALVVDGPFAVVNPYLTKTKADVVKVIASCSAESLIGHTVSCAHTMFMPKSQQHCGTCSQCIDRRIGVLAAGCGAYDPKTDYVSDVFEGPRKSGAEQAMAVHYARHATELSEMSAVSFVARFNVDLTRAVRGEKDVSDAMGRLYDLHQRHSDAVRNVLAAQLRDNSTLLADGRLDPTCMLSLIAKGEHREESWDRYAAAIERLLRLGIPPMCATHPPKDEPHLQELSDGILRGHDPALEREFPFMRWSSSATKPDFSQDRLSLWIELKYVRKKSDIRVITEDIAADITKYADNGMRALFVVYDPEHHISNDAIFAAPIVARRTMRVCIFPR